MDLDIDLECLHRPIARAVADAADSAQRVIYPLVPSWQREGSGAPAPAERVAQDGVDARPLSVAAEPSMRSAAAWVPTQSARLGTWPVPPASNDLPEAAVETARAEAALPVDAPADAPAVVAAPALRVPEGPALRRTPVRAIVGAHGQRWLQALPVALRPAVTARCHPHVIDRLAAAWPEPQAAALCLDDLLFNRRAGRRGFSLVVLGELCELQRALAERRRR